VVTLNVTFFEVKENTVCNFIATFLLSVLPFAAIVVRSDFSTKSWMHLVVRNALQLPLFYLTILVTVGACFVIDLIFHVFSYI